MNTDLDYDSPPTRTAGSRLALFSLICSSTAASVVFAFVGLDFVFERWLSAYTEHLLLPMTFLIVVALVGVFAGAVARTRIGETEHATARKWTAIAIVLGLLTAALGSLMLLGMWVLLYHSE